MHGTFDALSGEDGRAGVGLGHGLSGRHLGFGLTHVVEKLGPVDLGFAGSCVAHFDRTPPVVGRASLARPDQAAH